MAHVTSNSREVWLAWWMSQAETGEFDKLRFLAAGGKKGFVGRESMWILLLPSAVFFASLVEQKSLPRLIASHVAEAG